MIQNIFFDRVSVGTLVFLLCFYDFMVAVLATINLSPTVYVVILYLIRVLVLMASKCFCSGTRSDKIL